MYHAFSLQSRNECSIYQLCGQRGKHRRYVQYVHNGRLKGAESCSKALVCDIRLKHDRLTLQNVKSHHINSRTNFPSVALRFIVLVCKAWEGCLWALNNLSLLHFSSIQPSFFNLLSLVSAFRISTLYLLCPFCSRLSLLLLVASQSLQQCSELICRQCCSSAWDLCDKQAARNVISAIRVSWRACEHTLMHTLTPERVPPIPKFWHESMLYVFAFACV